MTALQPSKNTKIGAAPSIPAASHAAGTVNGTGVNCKGWQWAEIRYVGGAVAATGTCDLKVQESSDDGSSDAYADVTGAAIVQLADTDDDLNRRIEVFCNSRELWLRPVLITATAATIGAVEVILHGPTDSDLADDSDTTNLVVTVTGL